MLRIRSLPGTAEVTRAIGVLGADVSLDRVAALTGFDLRPTVAAVDALVWLRILSDTYPPAFTYSFLRDAVLADMPGATRPRTTHWPRDCCPTRAHGTNKWPHLVGADSMSHPWGIDVLRSAACKRRCPKPTACDECARGAAGDRIRAPERLVPRSDAVRQGCLHRGPHRRFRSPMSSSRSESSVWADDPDLNDRFCRMIETDAAPADHQREGMGAAVAHGVMFHMAGSLLVHDLLNVEG